MHGQITFITNFIRKHSQQLWPLGAFSTFQFKAGTPARTVNHWREACSTYFGTVEQVNALRFFHHKPSEHLTVFSPETVNIKKLANLTASTKNYE